MENYRPSSLAQLLRLAACLVLAGMACAQPKSEARSASVAATQNAAAARKPSIRNGDFEEVKIGAPFDSKNPADVPGWTHSGPAEALLFAVGYSDGGGPIAKAGHGRQFATLGGGYNAKGSASWSTTISGLTPGNLYELSFMIANEDQFTPQSGPQTVTVSFTSGSSTPPQSYSMNWVSGGYWNTWETKVAPFRATAPTAAVKFSVTDQQFDMGLDNVICLPARFSVKEDKGELRVAVSDAVLFDFDKATLKPEAEAVLAEIKSATIDTHPGSRLTIEGHTDNVGSDAYNVELSRKRAQSVAAWLEQHGVQSVRLQAVGYGKSKPRVSNDTAAHRAQNRRVEISIKQ